MLAVAPLVACYDSALQLACSEALANRCRAERLILAIFASDYDGGDFLAVEGQIEANAQVALASGPTPPTVIAAGSQLPIIGECDPYFDAHYGNHILLTFGHVGAENRPSGEQWDICRLNSLFARKQVMRMLFLAYLLIGLPGTCWPALVIGTSSILGPAEFDLIETSIGNGSQVFSKVFDKLPGDGKNALDFHAIVDETGPTLIAISLPAQTVFTDFGAGPVPILVPAQTIGGFAPASWSTFGGTRITESLEERTAFVFNFAESQPADLRRQKLSDEGKYQTFNFPTGPTWGLGYDLHVSFELESGNAVDYSYGPTTFQDDIIRGAGYRTDFLIDRLEVFRITQSAVPLPSSILVWLGLAISSAVFRPWRARSN